MRGRKKFVLRIFLSLSFASTLAATELLFIRPAHAQNSSPKVPAPQSPPDKALPSTPAQAKISVSTDLVVLPVTAKDAAGNLVPDLQQHEFTVLDDNVPQTLSVFTEEASPLSIVVLIDDDLKSSEAQQMSASLRALTGGISASDEVLVARFDVSFYPAEQFTTDIDVLFQQLNIAEKHSEASKSAPIPPINDGPASINGHSPTGDAPRLTSLPGKHRATKALDDAVFAAAELLQDRPAAHRKLLLIISDGENGVLLNHHTYEESLAELQKNNVSVFSLAIGSTSSSHRYARLLRYADQTGGDIFYAAKSDAMEKLYSVITEQARHEYTLAYVPTGNSTSSTYHVVQVRVSRPGVTVKTREGYYSAPANP